MTLLNIKKINSFPGKFTQRQLKKRRKNKKGFLKMAVLKKNYPYLNNNNKIDSVGMSKKQKTKKKLKLPFF